MGFLSKLFRGKENKQPEDYYSVILTDEGITVEHPNRETENILWKDIDEIRLINTDEGPFAPDVWLALTGKDKGCLIPQGCEGYDLVYDIVSKYEGFNFENVIKSMSCAENAHFDLWKRN